MKEYTSLHTPSLTVMCAYVYRIQPPPLPTWLRKFNCTLLDIPFLCCCSFVFWQTPSVGYFLGGQHPSPLKEASLSNIFIFFFTFYCTSVCCLFSLV